MWRRRSDDEELLPLELDDAEEEPAGRLVELGPTRRTRRDLGIVVGGLALVTAVLLTGDGGSGGETAEAEPRTPRTSRPATTTTAPYGTVTTTPGTGPVADRPTGSALVVSLGGADLLVVDLDTGSRCGVRMPDGGGWVDRAEGGLAYFHGPAGPAAIDARCRIAAVAPEVLDSRASDRPGHRWRERHEGDGLVYVEVGPDGSPSGREVAVPFGHHDVTPVAGGLAVHLFGSVVVIDADTGAARQIAHGQVLAAAGDRIAVAECVALACELVVRDVGGAVVVRSGVRPIADWHGVTFSPDGRWLGFLALVDEPVPHAHLVDLATGEVRDLTRTNGGPLGFTATSSHLVVMTTRGPALFPVGGGDPTPLDDLPQRTDQVHVISSL